MTDAALRAWSVAWMIARILTGEVGVVPQAAYPVAQVAMNRLEAGMGYDGWHAIAEEPEPWALDAAWEAWRLGGDRNGPLNALSKQDMADLGFDVSEWCEICSEDGRWCEYIGRWPK